MAKSEIYPEKLWSYYYSTGDPYGIKSLLKKCFVVNVWFFYLDIKTELNYINKCRHKPLKLDASMILSCLTG